jgi:hypothetical protein
MRRIICNVAATPARRPSNVGFPPFSDLGIGTKRLARICRHGMDIGDDLLAAGARLY